MIFKFGGITMPKLNEEESFDEDEDEDLEEDEDFDGGDSDDEY